VEASAGSHARAYMTHNHPDMPVEDMAAGQIKYKNGLRAIVELGEFAPQTFRFHLVGADDVHTSMAYAFIRR